MEDKLYILYNMDYTQSRGNIVELQCISKFFEYGIECSIPYGNGAKYDFIADINGKLIKVQCKAAAFTDNVSFSFRATYKRTLTGTNCKYTKEQIDYFATYYLGEVYLIPVEECSTAKTLRLAPPANGQTRYNKAEDYKFENVLLNVFNIEKPQEEMFKKAMIKHYCVSCGKVEVREEGKMCCACVHKAQRRVERPSREELKDMIRNIPFIQIAKKYGVSDKAIVKWCVSENLPSRKTDINSYSDEDWSKI